jgi:hypothetical protein
MFLCRTLLLHPAAAQFAFESMQAQQQQAQKYDRSHPGVGKAGKGDQATSSAINKSGHARNEGGARDQAGPTRG